jgi:PilZ domain
MKHLKVVRDFRRKRFLLTGMIRSGDGEYECVVLDLSPGGARLRVGGSFVRLQRVDLAIDRCGPLRGVIAWQRDGEVGVCFTVEPRQAEERIAEGLPAFRRGPDAA